MGEHRPLTGNERRWLRLYTPCKTGVHVMDPEGEFGGVTVANFPDADLAVFREISSAGEGDDFDLLCDLYRDGDLLDTATIRRQDLALIERAILTYGADNGQ